MPYIIILKVRKFDRSTINRFGTAGKKPVGGYNVPPPSQNRVNSHFILNILIRNVLWPFSIVFEGLMCSDMNNYDYINPKGTGLFGLDKALGD